ncbi:MAG TPA: hypothetical protein VGM90_16250 [Kofleriaceae bacterium]
MSKAASRRVLVRGDLLALLVTAGCGPLGLRWPAASWSQPDGGDDAPSVLAPGPGELVPSVEEIDSP